MSRSHGRWKLLGLVAVGALAARATTCGGCTKDSPRAPDERLALHFTHLCGIAKDGIDQPRTGIKRWLGYHGDHGPDMAAAMAETLVVIERTADDAAHDRRARLARQRLQAPLLKCQDTLGEFFTAVAEDDQAAATLERASIRLNRTLEILLGKDGGGLDPRAMLSRLDLLTAPGR